MFGVLLSHHYLKLVFEHSTPDFSSNLCDDLGEEACMDLIGLKYVTIFGG